MLQLRRSINICFFVEVALRKNRSYFRFKNTVYQQVRGPIYRDVVTQSKRNSSRYLKRFENSEAGIYVYMYACPLLLAAPHDIDLTIPIIGTSAHIAG